MADYSPITAHCELEEPIAPPRPPKGIQIVRKRMADGTIKIYQYDRLRKARPDRQAEYDASVYNRRLDDWLRRVISFARRRSFALKIKYSLTPEHLKKVMNAQSRRCAITDIEFDMHPFGSPDGARVRPFRPSIDRIIPRLGYVNGNVRFVCFAVNVALNEWGDAVFFKIASAAVKKAMDRRIQDEEGKRRA